MTMRQVEYRDPVGRRWVTLIPEGQPDETAPMGIPVGPVSLESLRLPLDFEVRLHNAFVASGLLTERDVRRRIPDVMSAIRSVLRVSAHDIIQLYEREAVVEEPDA